MTGWKITAVLGVAVMSLSLWSIHWSGKVRELEAENASLRRSMVVAVEQAARQRALDGNKANDERQLRSGGDEGLSDYMRDAAGVLWP